VGAPPVAVLEVDAQVLDRFARQLGPDALVDVRGQGLVQPEGGGEGGGVGGVFVEQGQGPVAPDARGVGGGVAAGDVDRGHGRAGARVAGVAALQFGVDRREGGAALLGDGLLGARRHPLLLALAHPAPLHVGPVHLAGNRTAGNRTTRTATAFSAIRNQQSVERSYPGTFHGVNTRCRAFRSPISACSRLSGTVFPGRTRTPRTPPPRARVPPEAARTAEGAPLPHRARVPRRLGLKTALAASVALPLSSTALSPAPVSAGEGPARPLEVMSFNLRFASPAEPHSWAARRPVMRQLLRRERPHVTGTQEGLYGQLRDIATDLGPAYDWIGTGRAGGSRDEFMAVLYDTRRLTPVEYDHFWLSGTPDVIASNTWGNAHIRIDRKSTRLNSS